MIKGETDASIVITGKRTILFNRRRSAVINFEFILEEDNKVRKPCLRPPFKATSR